MYFVYILECKNGTLYTGITTDVQRRFKEHTEGKGGHYTRASGVTKVLFTEKHPNRSSALKRENQIKGLRREKKLQLVRDTL